MTFICFNTFKKLSIDSCDDTVFLSWMFGRCNWFRMCDFQFQLRLVGCWVCNWRYNLGDSWASYAFHVLLGAGCKVLTLWCGVLLCFVNVWGGYSMYKVSRIAHTCYMQRKMTISCYQTSLLSLNRLNFWLQCFLTSDAANFSSFHLHHFVLKCSLP